MSTVGSSARNARPMAVRRSALVPATTTALKLGANLANSAPQLYTKDAGHTINDGCGPPSSESKVI